MAKINLFHKLARNLKTRIFTVPLEDYYFNTFTEYFSEIYEFALHIAISQELLGLEENEILQQNKAADIIRRYRIKYPMMIYDAKSTMFYIYQVKSRIAQKFKDYTTTENRKLLLESSTVPELYKSITIKPGAFKLNVYSKMHLSQYFKENYLKL